MTGYVHSNLGMEEDDDISESSWNYPIRVSSSLTYPQDPRLSPSSHSFVSPTHVDPTCPCEDGVSSQQWFNENDLRPLSPTPTRYSYVPETQFPSGTSFSKHPAWHPTDDLTEHNHPAGGTEEPFGRYQSKVAQGVEGDSCENTQEFPVQGELSNPDLDRSENMAYTPPPPPLPEPTSSTRHVHEAAANQKGRAVICDEAPPLNDIVVSTTDTVRREPPIQKGGELKFEESSQCSTGTKSVGPSNSTKPTPLPTFKDLLVTPKRGDVVEAKWNNGRWYQACVQEVNEPSRFVTICFEGRDSPRVALFKEIRPPSTTSVVPSIPRGNNPAIRPPHHGGTAATSTTRLETQVPTKAQDLRPGESSSESTSTTVSPDPFPAPTRMLPGKGSTGTSKASGNQGSLPSRNDSLSSVCAFGPKTTWTPPSAGESVEVRRANGRWGKATVVYVANGLVHATYDETGTACQVPLDQVRSLVGQPLASGSDARPSVSPPLEIITEEQTTSTPEKSVRAVSAAKCKSGDQGKIQHDDAQPLKDSKVENTITKANRSPSQQSRHQNDRVHRASNSRRRIPFVPMVDAPVDVKWRDCKWYPAVVVSVDDVMVRVRYIQVSSWTGDTEELVAMHHVRPRQETSTERREREAEVQQDKKEEWARAQKDAKTKSGRTHDELGSAPNAKRIRTGQSVPATSLTTNTHSCERQSLDSTIREKGERKSHHKKNHTMDEKPNISLAGKKKGQSNASSVFRTPVKVTVEKDQPCGVSVSERPKESNPRGSTMSAEALDMSDGEDEEITSYDGLRVGECYYCDASRVLTHVPVIESNETNRLKSQSTKGRTAPHIPSTTTRSFNDGTGGISRDATCHHRLGRIVGFVIPRHNIPLPEGTVRSPVCWVKLEWLDVNVTFLVHATLRLPLVRPSGETVYVPVEAIDRRVEPIVIAQKNIPHTFLLEAARSS